MEKKQKHRKLPQFDMFFFVVVMILLALGLVMLFSASYANAYYRFDDSYSFIKKQAIFAFAGLIAMTVISYIDYHKLKKCGFLLYGLAVVLMVIALFSTPLNGARRWIHLGPLGTFQPSEVMKFAIVVLFAYLISRNYNKMGTFKQGVLPFLVFIGFAAILMLLQPHLSGTILICAIGLVMMFVGGTKYRYFLFAIILVAVGIVLLVSVKGIDYISVRLNGWLDPTSDIQGETFQTWQSLIAIGSGGFMGLGLGQSRQKYLYLPEPQNDFIFSIVCEELGFVGAAIIIILFVLFVYRGFVIASKAPDKFGMMLAVGLTAQIGIQALLNIAVVTNTIPNTGISLPFFSYGGTALLMQLAEMGVILNISRRSKLQNG